MLIDQQGFFITSVFPKHPTATPTDKMLELIDAELKKDTHASTKDARKLNILPGVLFCRIVSNWPEYPHDLICATPRLCYATRAPPRKSESVSSHIQIFGGDKMDNTKLHEIWRLGGLYGTHTYILTMNGSLPRCFSRYRGIYALRSELENDTADCSQVITDKLCAQPSEQRNLLGVESLTVGEIIIPDPDTSAIAATDSFNGVCVHEYRNVVTNCPFTDIEFVRQIAVCIMPSKAQHVQQSQAPFGLAHALTPFPSLSGVNDTW